MGRGYGCKVGWGGEQRLSFRWMRREAKAFDG